MRVAINGFGRIGRCVFRAWWQNQLNANKLGIEDWSDIEIVAINEIADGNTVAYLTQYDSTHGKLNGVVSFENDTLIVTSKDKSITREIKFYSKVEVANLPWKSLDIDLVLECTGDIVSQNGAVQHIDAGAAKVLLSNPGELPIPAIVYGINHSAIQADDAVLSAASCTSNALAAMVSVVQEICEIESGVVTTIHAAMHDQPVIDAYHSEDLLRNRAASQSVIPVTTHLAAGVERVIPELKAKFIAHALRVPTANVSALNVTLNVKKVLSKSELVEAFQTAEQGKLNGVLGCAFEPLASCDFLRDSRSGIIDIGQLEILQKEEFSTVNLLVWFDNEWAFANRMLDLSALIGQTSPQ